MPALCGKRFWPTPGRASPRPPAPASPGRGAPARRRVQPGHRYRPRAVSELRRNRPPPGPSRSLLNPLQEFALFRGTPLTGVASTLERLGGDAENPLAIDQQGRQAAEFWQAAHLLVSQTQLGRITTFSGDPPQQVVVVDLGGKLEQDNCLFQHGRASTAPCRTPPPPRSPAPRPRRSRPDASPPGSAASGRRARCRGRPDAP